MPELPSGIVTFLFTDIEGSTRLLRRLRQRYADTLADHHRLLRSACAEAGGHGTAPVTGLTPNGCARKVTAGTR